MPTALPTGGAPDLLLSFCRELYTWRGGSRDLTPGKIAVFGPRSLFPAIADY